MGGDRRESSTAVRKEVFESDRGSVILAIELPELAIELPELAIELPALVTELSAKETSRVRLGGSEKLLVASPCNQKHINDGRGHALVSVFAP